MFTISPLNHKCHKIQKKMKVHFIMRTNFIKIYLLCSCLHFYSYKSKLQVQHSSFPKSSAQRKKISKRTQNLQYRKNMKYTAILDSSVV